MNSPRSNQTPRLYYGTEEINTLQTEKFNYIEFINVKEIVDYWQEIYKDSNLNISERNKIIEQIQTIYLEHEKLLKHFQYEINQYSSDEEDQEPSHIVNTISDDEKEDKGKRKAEEPLKEFSNLEEFQEFIQNPATDKEDFVKTT